MIVFSPFSAFSFQSVSKSFVNALTTTMISCNVDQFIVPLRHSYEFGRMEMRREKGRVGYEQAHMILLTSLAGLQ